MTPFDLLPTELQASVVELRQAGVSAPTIDAMIDRMLAAITAKANRVQVEVWEIESHLGDQLTKIGLKLDNDLQSRFGTTNGMVVDLREDIRKLSPQIEEARLGIAEVKKNWGELDQWRGRIEAALASFAESRDESKLERTQIRDEIQEMNARHGEQLGGLLARMNKSESDRRELHQQFDEIGQQFVQIGQRLRAIEALLEVAGDHEAGA